MTTAFLNNSGTFPDVNEAFMMAVIVGTTSSKQFLRRNVGNGSRVQDFVGDFTMIFLISSGVALSKSNRC